jgi:acetoacetyl-CoA synthetase
VTDPSAVQAPGLPARPGHSADEAASALLWEPDEQLRATSTLAAFAAYAAREHGAPADPDYPALWQWSVDSLEDFWEAVWRFFDVRAGTPYDEVLSSRAMPGARWFPGARLSFAEHLLRQTEGREDSPAVVGVAEDGTVTELSWAQLRDRVARAAAGLRRLGVAPGDRVVGYLPNVPEAVVAFLATASVGAVWSACAPDIGVRSAVDRFAQLEPVVLLAADGYRFGGKVFDRREAAAELAGGLPTLRHVVGVPVLGLGPLGEVSWEQLQAEPAAPAYEQVDADAPLWVVYSSGTTGLPKGLVHGHAGALLMGLAQQALQHDTRAGDRVAWYSSTTWIMWNAVVCAMLVGATAVVYDGSPLHPDPDRLWRLADEQRLTSLGTSPGYLLACAKAGLRPGEQHDLSALRALGVTGSPLPASSYRWVYDAVGPDVWLQVISGGTDFAAALVGDAPWLPVYAGEMSGRALGCHVEAWDPDGRPLVDEVGELVVLKPMPSMPLRIWGDEDGSRYRDAYFDVYPGVWRHGDWVTLTSRGTAVVHGRSDSTLNRHGVRMGSADIYQAVEALAEVTEALVLGVEQPDGGYWLPLFVVLAPGATLDDALVARIREAVRTSASPRHVPDEVLQAPAIPHTATGKKLEVPVKRIVQGTPVEKACNLGAVDDPDAVRWFAALAQRRAGGE